MSVSHLPLLSFRTPAGQLAQCPHAHFKDSSRLVTCHCRYCPRCGIGWAKNWEEVTRQNLKAYGGAVAIVTITAPGADLLPWACDREHDHSGWRGCRVDPEMADRWSENAPKNWRQLRESARKATKRATGLLPTLLERVWEPQKRGVPHLHLVLGMDKPEERRAAIAFVDALHERASEYFFGFVDRKLDLISANEAARYLSGYLLGRSAKPKTSIRENIADPRMPRSLIWLTPRLTRVTRVTMRWLRYARWYFAALNGKCQVYPRLFGDSLFQLARACSILERRGSFADGPPIEERERQHVKNLRLMRRIQPAYGVAA